MAQYLKISKFRAKHKDQSKKYKKLSIFSINKNSIGVMYLNGKRYEYNMHLLPTNRIDFDKINTPKSEKTRVIRIIRK